MPVVEPVMASGASLVSKERALAAVVSPRHRRAAPRLFYRNIDRYIDQKPGLSWCCARHRIGTASADCQNYVWHPTGGNSVHLTVMPLPRCGLAAKVVISCPPRLCPPVVNAAVLAQQSTAKRRAGLAVASAPLKKTIVFGPSKRAVQLCVTTSRLCGHPRLNRRIVTALEDLPAQCGISSAIAPGYRSLPQHSARKLYLSRLTCNRWGKGQGCCRGCRK
jgi:hypothetical protein